MQSAKCKVQSAKCKVQSAKCKMQSAECEIVKFGRVRKVVENNMKLQRMCAVCREMKSKNELLRVVRQPEGVMLDLEGKIQGRGAYICKSEKCIKNARKAKAFERSLSMRIDSTVYDAVEAWNENGK